MLASKDSNKKNCVRIIRHYRTGPLNAYNYNKIHLRIFFCATAVQNGP